MKNYHLTTFDVPNVARFAVGFDRLFADLNRLATHANTNYPPHNVAVYSETESAIEVAVAGFDESELDVEVSNNQLVIRGAKEEQPNPTVQYQHKGIATRNFELAFQLTDDLKVKGAAVKNGILTVRLEYIVPEEAKPKKVAITFEK